MSKIGGTIPPRISKKPPFSVEAPGYEPVDGETIPRRNLVARDELRTTPHEEIGTTFDNLRFSARKYGNARAIGSRRLLRTHVENKKVKKMVNGVEQDVDKAWTYYELSGYTYMSFVEYEKLALEIGAGLRKLGLGKDNKVHLFGATR